MLLIAEKRFRRLRSPHLLRDVYQDVQYVNDIRHDLITREAAA